MGRSPGEGRAPMFPDQNHNTLAGWWTSLGLHDRVGERHSPNERQLRDDILAILREYRPVQFERAADDTIVGFDVVAQAIAVAEREHEQRARLAEQQRVAEGWERIAAAYSAPDAQETITEGKWIGFTRARAIAWCWNLFQYEPKGFILPNSIVRERALRELKSGGIPAVFDYPERARQLEAQGMTPETYRRQKEADGAPSFSPEDVTVIVEPDSSNPLKTT